MHDVPYYPLNDFGPLMKGMVIGGLGILHVFLAQFAIGGGMLLCYLERLRARGSCTHAGRLIDGFFRFLVLASFVLGALTGVGMWFAAVQVSPRTIGLMVDEFHWVWGTEWTFFCLEVAAGYAFYRWGSRLPGPSRMTLLVLYTIAAWFSLFWVNGILSWQLTPGAWLDSHRTWVGFFNPSFWPSLAFRTVVAMTIAALLACVVVNAMRDLDRAAKADLIHRIAFFLAPMALMPALGAWYFAVIPADSREWALGGSPAMTLFLVFAVGASMLIGLYALVGLLYMRLYINGATATLLVALSLGATAGGEFVREGVRKPYTVRGTLLANSITSEEVARLREIGSVTRDPYPLRRPEAYPAEQLRLGARVFRFQCSVCHTLAGANGLAHLAGSWTVEQTRINVAFLQHTKPFMPPFAGDARELEALVQLIDWMRAGRPKEWAGSTDPSVLARIDAWMREAGTAPASAGPRAGEGGR